MKKRICAFILSAVLLIGTVLPLTGFMETEASGLSFGEQQLIEETITPETGTGFSGEEAVLDEPEMPLPEPESLPAPDGLQSEETISFDDPQDESSVSSPIIQPEAPLQTVPQDKTFQETDSYCEGEMSIEELLNRDMETAGAATEYRPQEIPMFFMNREASPFWYFDAYYVGEEDSRYICRTDDFSLKYQFEFHTDTDLEAGSVSIAFPLSLCTDRFQKEIVPSDIGVPRGTPEQFTELSVSPFNYLIRDKELVFFNYRPIPSGTNAAVQVLYKNLRILDFTDQTQWQLLPRVSVSSEGQTDFLQTEPLCGLIDSFAELQAVSKSAFKEEGRNATPGLYSLEQLQTYISEIPTKFRENFSDYSYVLWKVKATGNATQPWELYLKDEPVYLYDNAVGNCEIAGIQVRILDSSGRLLKDFPAQPVTEGPYAGYYKLSSYFPDFKDRKDIRTECYVVSACPKETAVTNKTVFTNTVELLLHPLDGTDEDTRTNAAAQWTWADYQWSYKGNLIGVEKTSPAEEYPGWVNLYRQSLTDSILPEELSFHVKSQCRGYGFTHETGGPACGAYIDGSYFETTTSDDVLYAYPLTGIHAGEKLLLSGEDYYFSEISIEQRDWGYDIFKDQTSLPEPSEKVPETDRSLTVYAMFKDSDQWERVDTVAWDPSGKISYTFPKQVLDRQPWRVKAVHNCTDYQTRCDIRLKVQIRPHSPVFTSLIREGEESPVIRLENLSAVTGRAFSREHPMGTYFHDQSTSGNLYQEKDLISLTQKLHQVIAMRDCRLMNLSPLQKHAGAQKYARAANRPSQERIEIAYTVSAWEGYHVFSKNMIEHLKKTKLPLPVRKQAVFYDLLPFGVQFDPSKEIKAGRLTLLSDASLQTPALWNEEKVTVQIDPQTDIVENYRQTGRTLLKFHVTYQGEDPSFYDSGSFASGFGISFHAYCSWKDMGAAQKAPNICACMPETGDLAPVLGSEEEVACDNGHLISSVDKKDYHYFGADINEDGITDIPNVLYCKAMAFEDIASASQSGIEKLVRADDDRFGIFKKNAVVGKNSPYTYEIRVTNVGQDPLKDIVIFDRLENAAADRRGEEPDTDFDSSWWHGKLKNIETVMLEEMGIHPVLYYHEDSQNAPLPQAALPPQEVLTEANGWYEASKWTGKLPDAGAVAVDISRKSDGSPFVLNNMESVSFRIQLVAPKETEAVHTYNNASFYSVLSGNTESIPQMAVGNSACVQLKESTTLELQKEVSGEIPDCARNEDFLFYITIQDRNGKKTPYASREYLTYFRQKEQWVKKEGIYSTDGAGRLSLKAGEKAVFQEQAGASLLQVEEATNPFWKTEQSEEITEGIRRIVFTNQFRPVLYLMKKVRGAPQGTDLSKEEFRFHITCSGKNAAEKEFWYVNQAAMYGVLPQKLGSGKTDKNGSLTIRPGEIIALFPGKEGDSYTVTELPDSYGEETNWFPVKETDRGTLSSRGSMVSLENAYRWKDFYLQKTITHQDSKDCQEAFSFQIWEIPSEPSADPKADAPILLTQKSWELLDTDRNPLNPPVSGKIGEDGILKCPCAGKIIRIKNLEADKTYRITEINVPEFYTPVNGGSTEVTMPVYASEKKAEITNDFQLRPLRVTKLVLPKNSGSEADLLPEKPFSMQLLIKKGKEYVPKAHFPYTVEKGGLSVRTEETDGEGFFEISSSETAVFDSFGKSGQEYRIFEIPDKEYPPVYPPMDSFVQGSLKKEGDEVTIINGFPGSLIFQKKYVAAPGDSLIEQGLKNSDFLGGTLLKAGFMFEIKSGDRWIQPEMEVLCIDTDTGSVKKAFVGPDQPLLLRGTEVAVFQTLKEGVPFRITELAAYRRRNLKDTLYTNSFITVSQKLPQNEAPLEGVSKAGLSCSITNELQSFAIGSRIYKTMFKGSDPIPENAELVFRAEEWDGASWQPAKGIRYSVMAPSGEGFPEKIQKTKTDGLISIFCSESGIPSLQFERELRPRPRKGAFPGELRITEVPELSDKAFGNLIGYSSSELVNSENNLPLHNLSPEDLDTFVNSNKRKAVEIEKKAPGNSSHAFTMRLREERGSDMPPVSSVLGLAYTIHNSETDELLGNGVTEADGSFSLYSGQYARFYLQDGSRWVVTETMPYPYHLDRIECSGNNTEVLPGGEAGICLRDEGYSRLTREMIEFGIFDPASHERLNLTEGDVVIPESVLYNGKIIHLTGIGSNVFQGCRDLTSLILPAHLRTIGSFAFQGCHNLKKAVLPESLQKLETAAFADCTGLQEITLSDSIKTMDSSVFENCRSLCEIRLPASLKKICSNTFKDCVSLTRAQLPDTITSIGEAAFSGCVSLTDLRIPEHTGEILSNAFSGCTSLTSISLPDRVSVLGASAFKDCTGLTEIILSPGLTSVSSKTFDGCLSLKKLVLPDSITAIGNQAFQNCIRLQEIRLPSALCALGAQAFFNCISLKEISLSGTLSSIENKSFYGCSCLEKIVIPASVTSVKYCAFEGCRSLRNLSLPEGILRLEENSFANTGLREITLPSTIDSIHNNTFLNSGELACIRIEKEENSVSGAKWGAPPACQVFWKDSQGSVPQKTYDEKDSSFYYDFFDNMTSLVLRAPIDRSLSSAVIPEQVNGRKVAWIDTEAFAECIGLKEVRIPSSVTRIGTNVFANCINLEKAVLPDTLSQISQGLFQGCLRLKEVHYPSRLTTIEKNAFYGCTSLAEAILPDTVTTIKTNAFQSCTDLKRASLPPNLLFLEAGVFKGCRNLTDIEIRGQLKQIGASAFENCQSLKSCILPDSVSAIGPSAFKGCCSLKSFIFPREVKIVDSSVFDSCSSLQEVSLSEKTTAIRTGAFSSCLSLQSISLPSGLTSIGAYAFENCFLLDHVKLPDRITSVEAYSFRNCKSLRDFSFGNQIGLLNRRSFEGCSALTEITLPSSITKVASDVFTDCCNLTRLLILKPKNSLSGAPWNAPNQGLIVRWAPYSKGGESR